MEQAQSKWIILNYSLPTEPSRHRVATWRALKKIGALSIQQSMWVLPAYGNNYLLLNDIAHDIEKGQGEVLLMDCCFFEKEHEDRVIGLFNRVRDDKYQEFSRECDKYLKEIEKEILQSKFTFAELEEEEAELDKLSNWFRKIEIRDLFAAPAAAQARENMILIKGAFEQYSEMVYDHETAEKP